MDSKVLESAGDVELADPTGGGTPSSDDRGSTTRDEGEMAYYGKKPQLKVHAENSLVAEATQY